ncbi:uncharacterized protein [Polyergus mexicanus]|uniref:uncharacterized protein n=1 Tax=Polyergus mexicanus TaxID=615972 RepID=UPI0038B4C3FA
MAQRSLFSLMLFLLRGIYINNIEEDIDDDEQIMMLLLEKRLNLRGSRVAPPRLKGFLNRIVPQYTLCQFRSHFRIAPATANELENRLAPLFIRAGVEGRLPIKPRTQILVNGSTIWNGQIIATSLLRAYNPFFMTEPLICWPEDHNINRIKEAFKAKAGMPDVIGAIDGSHTEIEAPKVDSGSNRTSKKKYAIQLQTVCDASLVFTDCFAGYPRAVHDARVLSNSPLHKNAITNEHALFPNGEYIIGNKDYQPARTWLIIPYNDTAYNDGALTQAHRNFNNTLSRTKQVIEWVFVLLKGRFRRLKHLHRKQNLKSILEMTMLYLAKKTQLFKSISLE